MSDKRPNILFAFADDWGRYASAYRQIEGDNTPNALLDTPNFDRIAHEVRCSLTPLCPRLPAHRAEVLYSRVATSGRRDAAQSSKERSGIRPSPHTPC